jgi:hypothetical protein
MTACFFSAAAAGVAIPLMFLVFGRLVGDLTGYFTPGSNITKKQFMGQIEKNTQVLIKSLSKANILKNLFDSVGMCEVRSIIHCHGEVFEVCLKVADTLQALCSNKRSQNISSTQNCISLGHFQAVC